MIKLIKTYLLPLQRERIRNGTAIILCEENIFLNFNIDTDKPQPLRNDVIFEKERQYYFFFQYRL